MIKKIDHIGIAVSSLAAVKDFFNKNFGIVPEFEEEVSDQKVKVVGFKIGESTLEFLEPTDEFSPVAKFLAKRGEGLHHLSLSVENIQESLNILQSSAVQLIDKEPRLGADGKKIAFIHPKSTFGILLELSQSEIVS